MNILFLREYLDRREMKCTGGLRNLHNEELHNLYSSPSIIRMVKSWRMRWAGHVARKGRKRRMHIRYWWESLKKRDNWEDQHVGG
jgi:hypothetical protein